MMMHHHAAQVGQVLMTTLRALTCSQFVSAAPFLRLWSVCILAPALHQDSPSAVATPMTVIVADIIQQTIMFCPVCDVDLVPCS